MFGCLRRVGCLVFLCILAVAGYFTRAKWMPYLPRIGSTARTAPSTTRGPDWQPVSDDAAARGRRAVESLGRKSGPVFVDIPPVDLASYFYIALAAQLPPSADSIEAAVIGNRMYVRSIISLDDFKAADALGPLSGIVGKRENLQMGGTFTIVRSGLAQFLVEDVKLGDLPIPRGAIPKLMRQIRRGTMPVGVAENGLPFVVPTYIADVRIANGKITLYKTTPK
jgi:hypothetical protein